MDNTVETHQAHTKTSSNAPDTTIKKPWETTCKAMDTFKKPTKHIKQPLISEDVCIGDSVNVGFSTRMGPTIRPRGRIAGRKTFRI